MERESLTIPLPRPMKAHIKAKLGEGFRSDQDQSDSPPGDAAVPRGVRLKALQDLSEKDWAAPEALVTRRDSLRNTTIAARRAAQGHRGSGEAYAYS